MKLQSLTLNNFKGIKSFTLDAGGENLNISGDNATGKTSIFDAFTWLLFDKDSKNRKDFGVKTLDKNNQAIHGLDHSVEGVFKVNNKSLTLKKVYSEKWTKKRGSAEKQFTGHTIDHFIDSVPVTKREYDARVSEICDESAFRLLTDPKYFNTQLHWQERRKLLIEVCGDVSDNDVIASNSKLLKLPEILGDHSLDDYRKIIAATRNEINKELEKIPVRIDEVSKGLPDLSTVDRKVHEKAIKELEKQIEAKEQQRQSINSGGGAAELRTELAELNSKMLELKNRLREEEDARLEPARAEMRKLLDERSRLEAEVSGLERKISSLEATVESEKVEVASMRDKWHVEDAKVFEFEEKDTCPTCGQSLPVDQVKEARDKAMADFNQEKATRLSMISESGKAAKVKLDAAETELIELKTRLKKTAAEHKQVIDEQVQLTMKPGQAIEPESDPEYQAMANQKTAIEAKIAEANSSKSEQLTAVEQEIAELKAKTRESETELAKFEQYEKGQQRIVELEAREKELASQYENLEEELFLTEEFIRSKVKLLEEKINSRFEMARFKLFNEQINGGIEECCDTLYDGVPYPDLNSGSQTNVGLDIIRTLSEHFGFNPPIFVDNKESITKLVDVNAQVIALVVSEKDKKLRIETVEQ
jgi:DNA repair exonuclease SbcCD ATPase subunit